RLPRRALGLRGEGHCQIVAADVRGEEDVEGALARLGPGAHLCDTRRSVVDPAEIVAGPGVDLDLRAGLQEQRHLDLVAGLERRRLGARRRAVALQSRLGVGDLEHDRGRHVDIERVAVVEGDRHLLVLQQEVRGVADGDGRDVDLVVVLGVHEDEAVAVGVEIG
ncbi:hypothetical protein ABE10_01430, partial [Bacillus toyonensis]|nr:hypothetical protein [Bacillus toyonensis]